MNIRFLGTAAGEGIPAIFCRCPICQTAHEQGGKEVRSRTSVLIDDVLKIDLPPDTWYQVLSQSLDLRLVRDLFITHSDGDHFDMCSIDARLPWCTAQCPEPLEVYSNSTVLAAVRSHAGGLEHAIRRNLLKAFETVHAQTATVTPLPANHSPEENCLLFWIERNGRSIFYAHDSGWFPEVTWQWLQNRQADVVILEGTNGASTTVTKAERHMSVDMLLQTRDRLIQTGTITDKTHVVATHFSHNGHMTHAQLEARLLPEGVTVASDGMVINLPPIDTASGKGHTAGNHAGKKATTPA